MCTSCFNIPELPDSQWAHWQHSLILCFLYFKCKVYTRNIPILIYCNIVHELNDAGIKTKRIWVGYMNKFRSLDSSASIATGYGMNVWGSVPGRGKRFLFHSVKTGSGVHPTSHPLDTRGHFAGVNRSVREADHSHLSSVVAKKNGAILQLPNLSSWDSA
jgi:hypothetical protein